MGGQVSYAKYWISLTDYFGMDSKIDSWLDFVTDSKAQGWLLDLKSAKQAEGRLVEELLWGMTIPYNPLLSFPCSNDIIVFSKLWDA